MRREVCGERRGRRWRVCVCVLGGRREGEGPGSGALAHVRWTSGKNVIATHLPLLPADAVQVRETAKLGGVVQWVQGQLLHREKS